MHLMIRITRSFLSLISFAMSVRSEAAVPGALRGAGEGSAEEASQILSRLVEWHVYCRRTGGIRATFRYME